MNVALLILGIILLIYVDVQIERSKVEYRDAEFDLATVNEKIIKADQTRINLNAMEQLATDLRVSSPEMQIVLQITWLDFNGESHVYDLYCDGINTATESMQAVTEREIYELREALAYQLADLNRETMHERNNERNDTILSKIGEWLNAGKDVREMWRKD